MLRKCLNFVCHRKSIGVFFPSTPHKFSCLWETAKKVLKTHLKKVTLNVKLTFEEVCTFLTQIEACLHSQLLVVLPSDDDCIEALTPGHLFLSFLAKDLINSWPIEFVGYLIIIISLPF